MFVYVNIILYVCVTLQHGSAYQFSIVKQISYLDAIEWIYKS